MIRQRPLTILLIAFIILGCVYSIVTPLFEASDEQWHYPMVKYVADHGFGLPVQDPATTPSTMWRQEGGQPPLYYMISAALTFWIDTSDLPIVRHLNPHADIGIVVPDGNANMMIHDPAVESFPWHGTVLAVHLIRFMSVLMGAVTVYMTYLLTLELFPDKRWLALTAAAFTAFNPMFLFISSSVNNDNLSNMMGSILLVMIVRLLKRTSAPSLRDLALIGIAAGAGMLAKFNIGFLLPLIGLSLAILAYRLRDWRPFIIGSLVTGGLTIAISAWWYIRNQQLYGDITGLNTFLDIVGRRLVPANLPQLWSERHTFLMSYWGFFGGVNVPLPDWIYTVFNIIALVSVIGLGIAIVRVISRLDKPPIFGKLRDSARRFIAGANWPILVGRIFTVIWIVVLFISLLRWTRETWASQGRLMFSAIAPLSMWMAVGLVVWPRISRALSIAAVGWFIVMGGIFSPLVIHIQYDPSLPFNPVLTDIVGCGYLTPCNQVITFKEPEQSQPSIQFFPEKVNEDISPGQYALFGGTSSSDPIFFFKVLNPFHRDWSVFVHLENQDGLIVAQRDIYLKQGLAATTLLNVGDGWTNYFAVHIPDYAYAPQDLKAYLGFYDLKTNERMIASGPNITSDTQVYLGTVHLLPRPSALNVPNPANVNFGNEAELVGYDMSSLVMQPGQKVKVTLYWRELHPMNTDYHVFVHIVNPGTSMTFGGDDSMPAAWTRPTTTWKPGEIIKDEHEFTVNGDAAPGTWQIEIGMYKLIPDASGANQFQRLRVITPDGGEADDFLYLSRVKIDLPASQ